jgi:hypothetical protein
MSYAKCLLLPELICGFKLVVQVFSDKSLDRISIFYLELMIF